MKTQCIQSEFELQGIESKTVIVKKDGEALSSDAGLVLLSIVER
ncbi:MAG: hypothetical protein NT080_05315 [Spirochaetes bacterium]|nr:hypothetical protein [Spirochaetota bacterium]